MTDDTPTYERRELLQKTAALPLVSMPTFDPSEAIFTAPEALSPLAAQRLLSYKRVPDAADIPTFQSADVPMWHVQYADGEASKLRDTGGWLASSSAREEHRHIPELNESQVSASDTDIHGLASKPWIESIDIVQTVSIPEPIQQLASQTDVTPGEAFGPWASFKADTDALDDGLAYDEDMPTVDIGDVRDYTNATASDFGGVLPDTSGLTIAVIDTGVNDGAVFEDATGSTRIRSASKDFIADETGVQAPSDGNSHGTWCAAAIAANADSDQYTGYAPAADILALKALADNGSGSTADIVAAVRYAADQGADLANLSLESPIYSEALDRAVAYAVGAGTAVFVAAGNDRFAGDGWVGTPADVPDAFAVAATTGQPTDKQRVCYFSSRGPDPGTTDTSAGTTEGERPDLGAPGGKLTVDAPGYGLIERSGTSMASPCTTGGAALVVAANSGLEGDPEAIYERLQYAGTTEHAGVTEVGDAGVLDVQAADSKTDPDTSQKEIRNDKAIARDEAHRTLRSAEGGVATRWLS